MIVHVCRKEHFCAAHKLWNPHWSKAENEAAFGPCANENWHGHNFELIVDVKGEVDPDTGFLLNMKDLGRIIKEKVIAEIDHKNLNMDVEFMRGKMTSCEVLAAEIWKILERELAQISSRAKLHSIELYETHKNFVRYYGGSE